MSKKKHPFIIGMLSIALIAICVLSLNFNKQGVYAVGTGVEIVTPDKVDYQVESHKDINEYRVKDALKAPVFSGEHPEKWVFAGWFKDIDCTLGVSSGLVNKGNNNIATGTYYAKYVSADVLSAKIQITTGTTSETDTVLRCVSTVDSLKYNKVGMDLVTPYGGEDAVKHMEKSKVSKKILARTNVEMGQYSYSPKVMDTESEYFFSATEPVESQYFDDGFTVKPYWITKDGTKVYGISRYVVIGELLKLQNGEVGNIYVPVKTEEPAQGVTFTVNEMENITTVAYDAEGGYAHLAVPFNSLKSATLYTITNADATETIGTYIYRNLLTKYDGSTADTSWYDLYTDEDEYVVATSADLYGISGAVTAEGAGFKDKTIYVVSDIEANVGYADKANLKWDTTKSANGEPLPTGTTGTSHMWTVIASTSKRFAGTFDGQMHTISGVYLYIDTTTACQGFFSGTGDNAKIKNFSLKNSYFYSKGQQLGSIVGSAMGTLDTIYSDALIQGADFTGGMIGASSDDKGTSMNNCWFDGMVADSKAASSFGGLVGQIASKNGAFTITNCLNTGTVQTLHAGSPRLGGLVGECKSGIYEVNISNSYNQGTLAYRTTDNKENSYGLLVGKTPTPANTTITNCYSLPQTDWNPVGYNSTLGKDTTQILESAVISGTDALTQIPNLFAVATTDGKYDSYWAVVPNGTPILSAFGEHEENGCLAIDASWYDGSGNYEIEDASDLYGLALLSQKNETNGFNGAKIKLTKDIQINAGTPNGADGKNGTEDDWSKDVAPDYNWIAIGDASGKAPRFAGTFDGKDSKGVIHTISGLYMNTTSKYQGLFGGTAASAMIQNFRLEDSYFHSTEEQLGSIVGNAMGKFHTIYSNAIVEGSASASKSYGGFIGSTSSGGGVEMTNCWFDGAVSNIAVATNYYGGLIGLVYNTSTVSNCLNTGKISLTMSQTPRVGGLVGAVYQHGDRKQLTITNSCNMGEIKLHANVNTFYGLLVGGKEHANDVITISNSYAVKQDDIKLVYDAEDSTYATSKVLNAAQGTDALTQMPNLFATATADGKYESYWAVVPNGTPILSAFGEHEENGCLAVDASWYDGSGNYEIEDAADLYGLALLSRMKKTTSSPEDLFTDETFTLTADITINQGSPYGADGEENTEDDWSATVAPAYEWVTIGEANHRFNGTFNGNMHKISGLYMNNNIQCQGLFSDTGANSKIQNFSLLNSYFYNNNGHGSTSMVGSIAGRAQGEIDTVYSDAIIESTGFDVGGFVGASNSTNLIMNNCWFDGSVSNTTVAKNRYGGLVGKIGGNAQISNCLNTGKVSLTVSKTPRVGGIVGAFTTSDAAQKLTITNCFDAGELGLNTSVETFHGLLVGGRESNGTIEVNNSYAITQKTTQLVYSVNNSTYATSKVLDAAQGTDAIINMPNLFATATADGKYDSYWAVVPNGTPILSAFGQYEEKEYLEIDTRWYDGSKATYTLKDAGDLYGFSILSQKVELSGFEGKTIQLEKDITINEATSKEEAEAWATDAPKYKWLPIGHAEKDYAFKGIFDGELHTINGLYVYDDTTKQMGGLFARTDSQAVVKNLKLTNSYIYGSTRRIGSIAGYGNGTFSDIYSNATVVCEQQHTGGLVGIVSGEITMSNCWFDGKVINKAESYRATGGLIGYVYTGKMRMSNCLNSGLVDASAYQYDQNSGEEVQVIPLAGGLVGYTGTDVEEAKIYDCLNVGEVRCHKTATSGYSPILGYETRKGQDNMETVVEIVRTYATTQCEDTSNVSGMVAMRETSAITGPNAATAMPLLDWDVQWTTTETGFPAIRFSQTGFVGDESRVVDADKLTTLSNYYAERTLYQGEMHDHAANGGASDGTVPLADWLEQMSDLQLDFAASLDHHMVSHFDGETWKNNRDKLLYGTEAGTIISGVTATGESVSYHYNMIFPNRVDFEKVLTSEKFASKFQYNGTQQHEVKYGDTVTYGEFQYPSFDNEQEFQELIQLVKDNNGFFGLAHPVVSHPYSPESVDDYYFADETGFEVIYGTLRDGNTATAYKAWKQLLTKGYRLWATAGKDGHGNLSTDALTSIYAKKTETENYLSEAFVSNLRQGNFTAGAVGIQMCVGDTQMGGTGSFEGKKLEIGIGEIHQAHFDSTHEYRVDVWCEDSVVYTTRIQRDAANEMTYISMDAEPNCRFYRVVVYDATSKTRVAIGNPIWNSAYYPSDN